ncbi:MAG: hypothetical protein COX30_00805 [Candidatus Moranbacteria bacterium CG23_combo_of_CG06-09_8_20_14_all_39_10]|nr:MAG: hypothetical protein COX30_00805 [Candidatus Moranbacteria bacterium CG23_combo_of_CG06-09_8_20_14_all_39_10]
MTTSNIILILVIIALGGWVWNLKKRVAQVEMEKETALAETGVAGINEKRTREKNERKEKILAFLKAKGKVTNNEIEKLLGVSDSTVTSYLDELEKESKVRQVGQIGQGVYYEIKG